MVVTVHNVQNIQSESSKVYNTLHTFYFILSQQKENLTQMKTSPYLPPFSLSQEGVKYEMDS